MKIATDELAAFLATDAEIRALPETDGPAMETRPLIETDEYNAAKVWAFAGYNDCSTGSVAGIFDTCVGEKRRCAGHILKIAEMLSTNTGPTIRCPYCNNSFAACWNIRTPPRS